MDKSEKPAVSAAGPSEQNELGIKDSSNGSSAFPLEIADGFRNIGPNELSPEEEARRHELCAAAISYAKLGWRVHPLWHVDKRTGRCGCGQPEGECKPGKHPRLDEWDKRATSDPVGVASWWRPPPSGGYDEMDEWYPLANIGLAGGGESGVFVADIDPEHGGDVLFEKLSAEHEKDGPIRSTFIVQTGSGGRHYYFRWPGYRIGNPKPWGRDAGIDIKGDGGYVVAPPSFTDKGAYSVVEGITQATQIASAPPWILERIEEHDKIQRGEPSRASAAVAPTGVLRAYGLAAIKAQARDLREAAEGDRNSQLNRSAFALGQLAPGGMVSEADAWSVLSDAAGACGLGQAETVRTFQSGWRSGCAQPFCPDWHEEEVEWPARQWNEFGLGHRMVDRFADKLRWNPGRKTWMLYLAGVWKQAFPETADWFAEPMIIALDADEAHQYSEDREEGEKQSPHEGFLTWWRKQMSIKGMAAASRAARNSPLMRITDDDCDLDPLVINLRNGTWDVRKGELLEHDPDQLLTLRAAVSYDPGAKCPKFQEFLDRVQPDKDAQAYLQRLMGYSLTGYTNEAIMVFHYGEGANGKSVFHDLMNRVFGDYAQTIPVETLIASRSKQGKVPNDVARMKGRRYLAASEAQEGTKLDAAMIKSLTGGEKIVARFMRAEFFEFYLIGTIHLTANHLQHLPNDPATHRRLNLCRWDVKIPEQERNLDLADQIFAEEAAGILNWVLQGVAEWRRQKLNPPQKILGWTRAYIEDENVVHRWMEDRCDVDRDATKARPGTLLQELFDDIGEWGRKTKTTPAIAMSRKVLAAELRKDDFLDKHGNKGIFFPQVCLKLPDVMR